jgi:GcrA cell cycle regulator
VRDPRPRIPENVLRRIAELWPTGMSAAEIGREVDKTKNAVLGAVHRLGLPKRPSPLGPRPKKADSKPRRKRTAPHLRSASTLFVPEMPKPVPAPRSARRTRVRECQWLICYQPGRPQDTRYCCEPAQPGLPYCAQHSAIAYRARERCYEPV